jgi:transcriptional antiterminator NusG
MDNQNPIDAADATNAVNAKDARRWYVVQTKPGDEGRVKRSLANQEIEHFLPLIGTCHYSNGKLAQRIRPLFPNYLFALLDLGFEYYKVKYTRGVSKILGNGQGPIPISERVIKAIRDRIGEDDLVRLEDDLQEGDPVQVTSGPLRDMMGILQKRMSTKGRVKIMLSLIGVNMPVQISRWQIKKVA